METPEEQEEKTPAASKRTRKSASKPKIEQDADQARHAAGAVTSRGLQSKPLPVPVEKAPVVHTQHVAPAPSQHASHASDQAEQPKEVPECASIEVSEAGPPQQSNIRQAPKLEDQLAAILNHPGTSAILQGMLAGAVAGTASASAAGMNAPQAGQAAAIPQATSATAASVPQASESADASASPAQQAAAPQAPVQPPASAAPAAVPCGAPFPPLQ